MRTRFPHVSLPARFVFALLLSALFALLLAGCGGGGGTPTGIQPVNIINGSNGLGGSTVDPAGDGTSGIKGVVSLTPPTSTSLAGPPIAGATIIAQLPDGTLVGKATSDSSGNYTIPLVPRDAYVLTAQNISAKIVPVASPLTVRVTSHTYTNEPIAYEDKSK